jgi:DNA-directed RNA polymerase subunit N (RpoN/RPB10)
MKILQNLDLKYYVNYESHTDYSDHGDCDGICRCGRIVGCDIQIDNLLSISHLISNIVKKKKIMDDNEINRYCIDRILVINKLYDNNYYEWSATNGYYGQEIDTIYVDDNTAYIVDQQLLKLSKLKTIKSKIEFILKLEYNQILPILQNRTWKIQKIHKSKLKINNGEYFKKINVSLLPTELPLGIVIKDGDFFKLIDGHHRISSNNKDHFKVIVGT